MSIGENCVISKLRYTIYITIFTYELLRSFRGLFFFLKASYEYTGIVIFNIEKFQVGSSGTTRLKNLHLSLFSTRRRDDRN